MKARGKRVLRRSLDWADAVLAPVQATDNAMLIAPYPVSLDDIRQRFCFTDRRADLFGKLEQYVQRTRTAEVTPIAQFISGSFVEDKEGPGDIDIANILPPGPDGEFDLYHNRKLLRATYELDVLTLGCGATALDVVSLVRLGTYYSARKDSGGRQKGFLWLQG